MTAIYAECVLSGVASYEVVPPDTSEIGRRFDQIVASGFSLLVACVDESVVGYAYASPFRLRPGYRYLVEDSIYLHTDWRGKGIGFALLDQLAKECTAQGFRQMVAVIGGAEPGSIALHQKAGFARCGSIHASGYKFDRWLDTVIMQLALGEGSTTLPAKSQS